jgi:hypothetical protein
MKMAMHGAHSFSRQRLKKIAKDGNYSLDKRIKICIILDSNNGESKMATSKRDRKIARNWVAKNSQHKAGAGFHASKKHYNRKDSGWKKEAFA